MGQKISQNLPNPFNPTATIGMNITREKLIKNYHALSGTKEKMLFIDKQ